MVGETPKSETPKCDCGRNVMHGHFSDGSPCFTVCAVCWRDEPRKNPAHAQGGKDLFGGLATTNPTGRYLCPCGKVVQPVNRFRSVPYYRCLGCGHVSEEPPVVVEEYEHLTPDELIRKLSASSAASTRLGPPRAIRALRASEGRDIYTGEPHDPK
jgi:hypothetical protein